jgi:hypothetical protein
MGSRELPEKSADEDVASDSDKETEINAETTCYG